MQITYSFYEMSSTSRKNRLSLCSSQMEQLRVQSTVSAVVNLPDVEEALQKSAKVGRCECWYLQN